MNNNIAPLSKRVVAYIIDMALIMIVVTPFMVWALLTALEGIGPDMVLPLMLAMAAAAACTIVLALLQGGGGSVGMRIMKIRLVDAASGESIGFFFALLRNIIWGAAGSIIVGYFSVFFDKSGNQQGWHDKATSAIMVRRDGSDNASDSATGSGTAGLPTLFGGATQSPIAQYGAAGTPQYGAQAQSGYGAGTPQLGASGQYGAPGQYGTNIQFGTTGQAGSAPQYGAAGQFGAPQQQAEQQRYAPPASYGAGAAPAAPAQTSSGYGATPTPQAPPATPTPPPATPAPATRAERRELPTEPAREDSDLIAFVPGITSEPRTPVRDEQPSPQSAVAAHDEAEDATVLNPVDRSIVLLWDNGTRHRVLSKSLFGRDPNEEEGFDLVAVDDTSFSLSKTHFAVLRNDDGTATIIDRHSTNGVIIERDGKRVALQPGEPSDIQRGDRIEIGGRSMRVENAT